MDQLGSGQVIGRWRPMGGASTLCRLLLRSVLERFDALATMYRLATVLTAVAYPVRFRWYRSTPLDAAVTLPDGRTVGIIRQGLTADQSGFAKRLWRLREGPMPGIILVLMADGVRLRHARRLLSTTDVPALFALEREALLAGAEDRVWSPLKVGGPVDLRYALDRTEPGGSLPLAPKRHIWNACSAVIAAVISSAAKTLQVR